MTYFVITCDEDGIDVRPMSEKELLKSITPDKEGYTDLGNDLIFASEVPEIDKGYWIGENKILIIKGEIVVPKPKKVVAQYEL